MLPICFTGQRHNNPARGLMSNKSVPILQNHFIFFIFIHHDHDCWCFTVRIENVIYCHQLVLVYLPSTDYFLSFVWCLEWRYCSQI